VNGRRAKARNRERARAHTKLADVDQDVGVLVGWCRSTEDLEETKRATHDGLISLMGDRRTGGVRWRICTGETEGNEALRVLRDGVRDQALLDHYRRLAAHLREWGGHLVVAMAEGTPPETTVRAGQKVILTADRHLRLE
jgi:hypothetical protein